MPALVGDGCDPAPLVLLVVSQLELDILCRGIPVDEPNLALRRQPRLVPRVKELGDQVFGVEVERDLDALHDYAASVGSYGVPGSLVGLSSSPVSGTFSSNCFFRRRYSL